MNRRELIQSMALLSGSAMLSPVLSAFLTGCANKNMSGYVSTFFTREEFGSISEIVDIIIPATQSKSASQVNTQVFLDQVFTQCFTQQEQVTMRSGVKTLVQGFNDAKSKQQYIIDLDKKAFANDEDTAYFKTLKRYTMIGFFTSQEGETRASNYVKIPDAYKGEITMDANTLNYGKTSLHF